MTSVKVCIQNQSLYYSREDVEGVYPVRKKTWEEVLALCAQLPSIQTLSLFFYDATRIPASFPVCRYLNLVYTGAAETIVAFPKGVLVLPTLYSFRVDGRLKFQSLPPSFYASVCKFDVALTPYWLCDRFQNHQMYLYSDNIDGPYRIGVLLAIVCRGLAYPQNRFRAWLTQGLYDPRLFALIRDFLL